MNLFFFCARIVDHEISQIAIRLSASDSHAHPPAIRHPDRWNLRKSPHLLLPILLQAFSIPFRRQPSLSKAGQSVA